ncbi:MAG: putative sugar O-methyltransferase, partial [Thermomicrobiales bacterium]
MSDPALNEMYRCLEQGDPVFLPSRFWETLGGQHRDQLTTSGYANFKRTLASNYFTWLISPRNNQSRFLARRMAFRDWNAILREPFTFDPSLPFPRRYQRFLQIYTRMLWRFVERGDTEGILQTLPEPTEGNPFPITLGGRLISQDLANSVLEYYAIREHFRRDRDAAITIAELGAGYGRNAYVLLNQFPHCRYIVIDIPPALYVAQRYLQAVFPEKRVAQTPCEATPEEIAAAVEAAEIAFLLPH